MTRHHIVPFLFDGQITVRVIDREAEPWFVAVDVCRALGLTNAAEAVKGLDDDEKGISATDTLRGQQEVVVVSESGLFALIFRSRKPNAVAFRKWVTSEVLPALRKSGAFVVDTSGIPEMPRKPWQERPLEERRVDISTVRTACRALNPASGAWMWGHLGMPMPPRNLLPVWWQGEMIEAARLPAN